MSTAPTRASGYRFAPAPAPAILDRAAWDGVVGDIDLRLDALEAKRSELQALIDDLSFNGQQRIDEAISPLIASVRDDLVVLSAAVAKAVDDAANAAVTVTAEVRTRVTALEGKLASVEAEFNRILASGLAADRVEETPTRAFISPEQKIEIGRLREDVELRAPLDSPSLKGNPTAPTAPAGDADQSIANTAFVQREAAAVRLSSAAYALAFGGF